MKGFLPDIPKAATAPRMRTVYKHPDVGSWFENIAVRPSGGLLVTRIDTPELWAVDPDTGTASIVTSFAPGGSRSLMGITEVKSDVWVVGVGIFDQQNGGAQDGSWKIWLVDLSKGDDEPAKLVAKIPEAGMINGLTTWDENSILAVDSKYGAIYHVNVVTGAYTAALRDPDTMAPPAGASIDIGINGVRVQGGFVYYSNTMQLTMYRVPIDGGKPIPKATGPAEIIAKGIVPDDFCFDAVDKNVLYVTGNPSNVVSKITLNKNGSVPAKVVTLAGGVDSLETAGATACAVGRRNTDRKTLYVTTCGGLLMPVNNHVVESAKIVAIQVD
jgi:hypothetical protein